LPVIAAATGNYSFEELAALEPEVCTSSLAALMKMWPGNVGILSQPGSEVQK